MDEVWLRHSPSTGILGYALDRGVRACLDHDLAPEQDGGSSESDRAGHAGVRAPRAAPWPGVRRNWAESTARPLRSRAPQRPFEIPMRRAQVATCPIARGQCQRFDERRSPSPYVAEPAPGRRSARSRSCARSLEIEHLRDVATVMLGHHASVTFKRPLETDEPSPATASNHRLLSLLRPHRHAGGAHGSARLGRESHIDPVQRWVKHDRSGRLAEDRVGRRLVRVDLVVTLEAGSAD